MAYNFSSLRQKVKYTESWFQKEISSIRTGRATPLILDSVTVEAYGARMPINQLASIGIEGARSLRVSPYDKSTIRDVERAITAADLGVGVSVDDEGIRINFPELTGERRTQLIKVAKEKLEEARIALRREREEVWADIQKGEKEGKMSEDEKFRAKDEMQKLVDEGNRKLEELFDKKEKEITS